MRLDEHYSIATDTYCVSLLFRREKEIEKNGEKKTVTEKDSFHFATVQQALKRYVQESIKECKDAQEVLKKIDELEKRIDGLQI